MSKSIEAGNKLIAEFMGWVHHEDPNYDDHEMKSLKYNSSWDWLMPVVEKIDEVCKPFSKEHYWWNDAPVIDIRMFRESKEATWQAVVQFIQWYNNQKSKP